jgi:hypothetical protein
MKLKKTSPQNNGDLLVRKSKKKWVKMAMAFQRIDTQIGEFGDGK